MNWASWTTSAASSGVLLGLFAAIKFLIGLPASNRKANADTSLVRVQADIAQSAEMREVYGLLREQRDEAAVLAEHTKDELEKAVERADRAEHRADRAQELAEKESERCKREIAALRRDLRDIREFLAKPSVAAAIASTGEHMPEVAWLVKDTAHED